MKLQRESYKGWEAWHLHNGPIQFVLVPQVGGRMMGLLWRGHDLSFTPPERHGQVEDLSQALNIHAYKQEMGFPLWGGDQTWLGPQSRWTDGAPFLDLDSGAYDLHVEKEEPKEIVIRMTSPVCRETGARITRTLRVKSGSSSWVLTHRLSNTSQVDAEWGIGDVTMMLRPGRVYLPRSPSSFYPNGIKTFDEEGESVTVRDRVVQELGHLAVVYCDDPHPFKFGVDAAEGWMLGVFEVRGLGLVGYRREVPVFRNHLYGHGCVTAVLNSARHPYCELESHGPLLRLQPGASFELHERHALFDVSHWPQSEKEVRQLLTV